MLTSAASGASPTAGHPLWHSALLAAVAVVVFLGIKVRERMSRRAKGRPRRAASQPARIRADVAGRKALLLGYASAGAAALHAVVCPAHFSESAVFGAFFLAAAVLQGTWAVLIVTRPTQHLLATGIIANTIIVIVWLFSRTVGLPIGP